MLTLRELFDVFRGRVPVESFAVRQTSLADGAIAYAFSFGAVSALLLLEFLVFRIGYWVMTKEPLVSFIIGIVLAVVVVIVLIPIAIIAKLVAGCIWGAVHYTITRFFSNKPGTLNDFNGSLLALFASLALAEGLAMLIPVIGWFAACLIPLYGLFLMYKFMKAKFNLTDAQAAIAVLVPFNAILGLLLVAALASSFILIGMKFF